MDELVLVIPTRILYEKRKWSGFRRDRLAWFRRIVERESQFRPRREVEIDPSWKQVIPQVIFTYRKKIYFHQIGKKGSEGRLHEMYPIFLGGHVNPIDQKPRKPLLDAAADREFFEEVRYRGSFLRKDFVGVVNLVDDNMVNRVHVGPVFVYEGSSPEIKSREPQVVDLGLHSIRALRAFAPKMTFWSQAVYPHLGELL